LSDSTGQLLGNYKLVRLLGQGGFSDVYLGEHVHLNTYAAIKILRTRLAEDSVENFRTEARTLAHLKHPNIVQVLDFGVDGMTPYLVMQYAPNGTLRQRHPRGVPVALNVVVSYVKQMATALQYAHNQKLIHRDIKPENMLVGEQNQVLLSDFGIAVVTASARAADPALAGVSIDLAGTVSYMAPEQIQGKTIPASDQYALAVVVYEWLTGVLPFNGSYMEVVSQQISAAPAALREKAPSILPDVEQVVLTALNKDPQKRFGRIEAFANALQQVAQDSGSPSISGSSTVMSNIPLRPKNPLEVSTMEVALIGPLGRIVIGAAKVSIGRATDNTLVLSDAKASSHHVEIRPEGQYYSIVDLGSMNGTFVNEQQVYSGVPRLLQPGDIIRVGDTKFTFEVSGAQLGTPYSGGSTVLAAPPPPPTAPNFAGNTSYGVGNMYGSSQSGYEETMPASSPLFTPPNPAYPGQQPSYTPTQPPSYVPGAQRPIYVPSSYAQSGQQPSYTPPQQPYSPPPEQPQKRSPVRAIVLAVIALVIILGGVGSFFLYQNNQNQQHIAATATARTQANNNATATVLARQNATATAFASTNLTATAVVTSHFPPFTTLSFHDPLNTSSNSNWSSSTPCQASSNGYQVSIAQVNTFEYCSYLPGMFGEFAYQATMNIQQGDCGGLIFKYVDSNNLFLFEVCQNGTYNLNALVNNQWSDLYTNDHPSAAIQQGLNKQNVLAVTVQGDTVNMYVNGQKIDTATDQDLTSSKFSTGGIALVADDVSNPTTVIYTDALVWTQ
jgi:serine/threonine protein kinase